MIAPVHRMRCKCHFHLQLISCIPTKIADLIHVKRQSVQSIGIFIRGLQVLELILSRRSLLPSNSFIVNNMCILMSKIRLTKTLLFFCDAQTDGQNMCGASSQVALYTETAAIAPDPGTDFTHFTHNADVTMFVLFLFKVQHVVYVFFFVSICDYR